MKIRQIAESTARILNLTSALEALKREDAALDEEVAKLLTAVDFIVDEIARDYFPLIRQERLCVKDGRIAYTDFSRLPVGIIEVKRQGKSVPFSRLYDGIAVEKEGEVEVKYCFKPEKAVLEGETEWEDSCFGVRLASYGAAAEYCVMNDMAEEAVLWDKRYRDALERAVREKTRRTLPRRRWFL